MNRPRYLIAKYIPDLRRVEPRNIGVVLWSPHGIAARFLAEKPGQPGHVDGRSIPSFVTSTSAYKQWVEFWRTELDKTEIESVTNPEHRAGRDSETFLEVLAESSKGNFVLAQGGFLLDAVEDSEEAADYLFSLLIETGSQDEPRDPNLDELCDQLIEQTHLGQDPNFHSSFPVTCTRGEDVEETYEFSHAYRNGAIKRLFQRVPLSRRKANQRKNVHDAAWMFEGVTRSRIVTKNNAVSLVYIPTDLESDTARWLKVLGTVSRVVNVGDEAVAKREFEELPALASHD